MSVIGTLIEPGGVTRIFFDYRRGATDRDGEALIAREITRAGAVDSERTSETKPRGDAPLAALARSTH
jgi:hypothetical protein